MSVVYKNIGPLYKSMQQVYPHVCHVSVPLGMLYNNVFLVWLTFISVYIFFQFLTFVICLEIVTKEYLEKPGISVCISDRSTDTLLRILSTLKYRN